MLFEWFKLIVYIALGLWLPRDKGVEDMLYAQAEIVLPMSYAKVSVWLQALWIGPIEVGLP